MKCWCTYRNAETYRKLEVWRKWGRGGLTPVFCGMVQWFVSEVLTRGKFCVRMVRALELGTLRPFG